MVRGLQLLGILLERGRNGKLGALLSTISTLNLWSCSIALSKKHFLPPPGCTAIFGAKAHSTYSKQNVYAEVLPLKPWLPLASMLFLTPVGTSICPQYLFSYIYALKLLLGQRSQNNHPRLTPDLGESATQFKYTLVMKSDEIRIVWGLSASLGL